MRQQNGSLSVAVLLALSAGPATAAMDCLAAPYAGGSGEVADLAARLTAALAPHPSLTQALGDRAPDLCIDDMLYEEQGYYEPRTNRIVLRAGLDPDLQLAILIHEIRHLEQYGRDVCPTTEMTLTDYMRLRLALEADAAAVGIYVAWQLNESGTPGPLAQLSAWPSHIDLVARFTAEMAQGKGEVAATAAAFEQWFADESRRAVYAFAICTNYLDALDREKVNPGVQVLPEGIAARLCVLPDGRPYDCVLPP
jgi:hypothetical protein